MVKKTKHPIRASRSDRIFAVIVFFVITLIFISVLYPLVYVVSSSFSSGSAVSSGKVILLPKEFSLEGYKAVFRYKAVLTSYKNTIVYTVVGTLINISMAMITAYPLSRRDLPLKNGIMFIFVFTMYFGGGMMPSYILMRNLGLLNSFGAMVVPGALSVYNMILARTFIQSSIPPELFEAARIDGASDIGYFIRIVLPLSKAILAVLAVFSAVGHWNSYFNAMLYLNDLDKMPLQIIVREILVANNIDPSMIVDHEAHAARQDLYDVLKYALIMVCTVPILLVYPFAQRYFASGVMIGSVKG